MLLMKVSRALLSLGLVAVALCVLGKAQFSLGQEANSTSPPPHSASPRPTKLPDDVAQVLWWLPEETEAVVVSKGNVPIKELQSFSPLKAGSAPTWTPPPAYQYSTYEYEYQDLVAMNCVEPLVSETGLCHGDLHGKMLKSLYGPKTASLFVKAAWWEKDQTRASCDIVVFRDDMAARIVKSFAALRNVPRPRNFDGVRVLEVDLNSNFTLEESYHLSERQLRPDWRFLAAPRPNVYVATTNRQLMRVIIARMKRRGKNRALPADLPEWQHVDPTLPAWGVRHYHPAIADKDLTSMLRRDPNAQGLVFFGSNKPSPFLCLRYVSKSEDAGNRFLRLKADCFNIKDYSKLNPMQRINTDCVEDRLRINANLSEVQAKRSGQEQWTTEAWTAETTFYWINMRFFPFLGFAWQNIPLKSQ